MTRDLFPPQRREARLPKWWVVSLFALSLVPTWVSSTATAAPPQAKATPKTKAKANAKPKVKANPPSTQRVESEGTPNAKKREVREGKGRMSKLSDAPKRVAMAPAPKKDDSPTSGQPRKTSGSSAERTKSRERDRPAAQPKRGSQPGTTRSRGSKKISIEDDFLIEGKLEKPSAYYILRRSRAEYDWARLDAKFLPLVLESVQDPLF